MPGKLWRGGALLPTQTLEVDSVPTPLELDDEDDMNLDSLFGTQKLEPYSVPTPLELMPNDELELVSDGDEDEVCGESDSIRRCRV